MQDPSSRRIKDAATGEGTSSRMNGGGRSPFASTVPDISSHTRNRFEMFRACDGGRQRLGASRGGGGGGGIVPVFLNGNAQTR